VVKLANEVDALVKSLDTNIKVAVMGCEVNGPGESKDADIGIAGGNGRAIIFRKGQKTKVVAEADMLTELMNEIHQVMAEREESGVAG
ncbi:MAG: flavodoxin-dependent (E)-4-hydroxy-3-methylbut-2-enyl-diphosphate synthase, partial [Chloroflexota bacterium]|nr:flavodoxin-dependent (E)-4-hydroxy-3-methylbut-2-enyl-diphosphate synthase [Chloroflexota bacterium]